ncbi:MAG: redoxin domain-containing protein, partial [Candidatus Dadabacteria bacterium]|nr:redoxin domain-containing protein [Candidatus Dadabacteria bacterium]
MGKSVKIGDLAPNFRLLSQTGQTLELQDYFGTKPVVLFFYPKDNTTLCTKEVCHFRDNFDEFKKIYNA